MTTSSNSYDKNGWSLDLDSSYYIDFIEFTRIQCVFKYIIVIDKVILLLLTKCSLSHIIP